MFVSCTKSFLRFMLLTLIVLNLRTVEAKTFYIITIYGDDKAEEDGSLRMKDDCERMVNLFKSVEMPGGYIVDDNFLRLSDYTEQSLIDKIATITNKATSSDVVLIYVATHGGYYRDEDGMTKYIYHAKSTPPSNPKKRYDQTKIFELLEDSKCFAKLKLIITDTCTVKLIKNQNNYQIEETDEGSNYNPSRLRGSHNQSMVSNSDGYISASDITYRENKPRLRDNLDWLLEAEGFYFVSSSLRGTLAKGGVLVKMFYKFLNEEVSFQKEKNVKRRCNVFWQSFVAEFDQLESNQRFCWDDFGKIEIPRLTRNLAGRFERFDPSKGVIVVWTQHYHSFCPAEQAGLKRGDIVLAYILGDTLYSGETSWTYMNCTKDTFELSKQMQKQHYMHLIVMRRRYAVGVDYSNNTTQDIGLYYKTEIVKNIDLQKARFKNETNYNDLKFGMSAMGYDEL